MNIENPNRCQTVIEHPRASDLLSQLNSGQLLMVNRNRRNGLIIYKRFHAEFAGPGAAVGGFFDSDCVQVVPVGNTSLVYPETHEDRKNAYLIRLQWVRLTQQLTDNPTPLQRAQKVLDQFENFFDVDLVKQLPDEAFALLVGVLPQTINAVRHTPEKLETRLSP
ncbi:MAG: hypothetical protein F6K32_08380 [Desertifilum sp. SIO1I2]|nr:hypothetical protein [Desertifilum sp. SIO1I2]